MISAVRMVQPGIRGVMTTSYKEHELQDQHTGHMTNVDIGVQQ